MRGGSHPGKRASLAALICAATAAFLAPDASAEELVKGRIKAYECAGSCFLTVTGKGGDVTGLCSAAECNAWNSQAKMPAGMIGSRVTVAVGRRKQYDANGNVTGEIPAFTDIIFGN